MRQSRHRRLSNCLFDAPQPRNNLIDVQLLLLRVSSHVVLPEVGNLIFATADVLRQLPSHTSR